MPSDLGADVPAGIRRRHMRKLEQQWNSTKNGRGSTNVHEHGQCLQQSLKGCTTLGVAVGPRAAHRGPKLLAKADVNRAMHERVQLCQDPFDSNLLSFVKVWVSRVNHTPRVHWHHNPSGTAGCGNLRRRWQRSLERLFPEVQYDASQRSGAVQIWDSKERETLRLRHTWELSSQPNRSIQAMIQDAVTAWPSVIERATSTYLGALDDEDKATAKLYVQKAAHAADEAVAANHWRICKEPASQTRQSAALEHRQLRFSG